MGSKIKKKESDKNKVGILIGTGLGNALQLIPLCKRLKEDRKHLSAIIASKYVNVDFINNLELFDQIFEIKSITDQIQFIYFNFFKFSHIYIEYSASSLANSIISSLVSNRVISNRNKWYLKLIPNFSIRHLQEPMHLLLQNLHLAYPDFPKVLEEVDFNLGLDKEKKTTPKG